jgi:hypothetical protein
LYFQAKDLLGHLGNRPTMFPLIVMMPVWKKFLVRRGIAINAWQAADFLLFMQINDFCKH